MALLAVQGKREKEPQKTTSKGGVLTALKCQPANKSVMTVVLFNSPGNSCLPMPAANVVGARILSANLVAASIGIQTGHYYYF